MAAALELTGNPSSIHAEGRHARRLLEEARASLARQLAVAPEQLVLTGGGTEANHLALLGCDGPRLVAAIEHPSVLAADPTAATLPVDPLGRLDLDRLAALLAERRPRLVAVMLANNETGVLQPVAEAARLAHAHGALLHCDAVQALGKLPFTFAELGADLLALSAHKLGGPPGVGALVLRPGLAPRALLRGGGQERHRRAGTENLPGIAGFAAALAAPSDPSRLQVLRDRLEAGLRRLRPDLAIVGEAADRLPNTSCILLPGRPAETQLIALDLAGIAVSSGSACSSGKVGASHVLAAMGYPPELARCAIRVSLSWASTSADIDGFLDAYARIAARQGP